jgi:hypothetical protein
MSCPTLIKPLIGNYLVFKPISYSLVFHMKTKTHPSGIMSVYKVKYSQAIPEITHKMRAIPVAKNRRKRISRKNFRHRLVGTGDLSLKAEYNKEIPAAAEISHAKISGRIVVRDRFCIYG